MKATNGVVPNTEGTALYAVNIYDDWCDLLNIELDKVAQVMPYAKITLTLDKKVAADNSGYDLSKQKFTLLNIPVYFALIHNNHYDQRLINTSQTYTIIECNIIRLRKFIKLQCFDSASKHSI